MFLQPQDVYSLFKHMFNDMCNIFM
uniref:Uncharacterized protein n=1 Tax=Anguilla anguilla TaxID=7936 RepID=A0A0E9T7E2_ANGAN